MAFKNKPIKTKQYKHKQSAYEHMPTLPTRQLILAPSASGKTVLLVNQLIDLTAQLHEDAADCFNDLTPHGGGCCCDNDGASTQRPLDGTWDWDTGTSQIAAHITRGGLVDECRAVA